MREQLIQFIKAEEPSYPLRYLILSNTRHLQELKESFEREKNDRSNKKPLSSKRTTKT